VIVRDALTRSKHWARKDGDDMLVLFSCFVEGARSAERDDFNLLRKSQGVS
jgi:hypothetical protein